MRRQILCGQCQATCFLTGMSRGFATMACPRTLLGVGDRCTADDVKKAYRQRAKEWHPDLCAGDKKVAVERFQQLQAAYQALLEEIQTGRKPASSASSQAGGSATRDPNRPSWADTRVDPSEWAEEAGAYKAPEQPLVMQLHSRIGDVRRGLMLLCAGLLAWTVFDARSTRQQEIEDELEFGAKKVRLRQEHAERAQQEMLSRRSTRQQHLDDRIAFAERSAAQAAQRRAAEQ
mmetsp:Transcript_32737/g.59829  ORF Transcript_32737/g.59829 Transcript_32737/m.59829 type:complete len:233 (-) Transcript_32737:18-716(-)